MAEKEERILCSCYTGIQAELMANNNIGMTRQEAIERMAKALHFRSTELSDFEKDWEKLDKSWQDSFCKYAEAALNALLEDNNER